MPARGRRSAKPFTRRRSAAAFRLRPPVPRMNLSPNRGREDGAAVRPGPPGVVRLRPLLAGRQVLPGWGMAARSAPCGGRFAARSGATVCRHLFADVLLSASFYRRPFAEGLFRRPVLWVRCRFFVPGGTARTSSFSSLSPLRSDPSPLRPLSALPRPRPVPSPLRPRPVPVTSPFRPRSVPVPSPFRPRSCPVPVPVPVPALPRPCPVPAPSLPRSLSLSLSRSCPLSVLFLSCPRPRLRPRSRPRPVPVPVPSFGGAPLRRFFSVRGLKNRKNCLDL